MGAWRERVLPAAGNPWLLVLSGFGGAIAWALGEPLLLGAGVAGLMWAVGGGLGALTAARGDQPGLRPGTEQARLVEALEGYLADLRALRGGPLPSSLTEPAVAALEAADGARSVALRVAVAVDGLDAALARSASVGGGALPAGTAARASVQRMAARRAHLLDRLRAALAQVQDLHTALLELSATAPLSGLPEGDGRVGDVQDRLDGLRQAFAELDAVAARPGAG